MAEVTIRIEESEQFGVSLHVSDYEAGDEFDDWMVEQWDNFYAFLFPDDGITFLFGDQKDAAWVRAAYRRFELETDQPVMAREVT